MASGSQSRGSSKQTSATPSSESLPKLVKEMSASFARLAEAVRTSTEEIQEALEEQQEAIGEVPGQLAEGMAAVRDAIADLTETQSLVEERLADVASSVVTATEVEKAVDSALTGAAASAADEQIRGAEKASARIEEALTALARRLGQSVAEIREEARQAVGAARDEVMAVSRSLEELRTRFVARTDAIEGGLTRVDELSAVIDSLGRRRGFRELVETERKMTEQQQALTDRLTEAAGQLSDRVGALETRLQEVADAVDVQALHPLLAERAAQAVEQFRTSLAEEMGERIGRGIDGVTEAMRERVDTVLPSAIEELRSTLTAGLEAEVEGAVNRSSAPLREDLAEIRRKIAAWGRVRSAPRIAEEIGTLDERLGELERAVQEELVEQVFDRMQGAFDRRFEALVRLVESRLREATQRPAEPPPRGWFLFRRREIE